MDGRLEKELSIYSFINELETNNPNSHILMTSSHVGDVFAALALLEPFRTKWDVKDLLIITDKKFLFLLKIFQGVEKVAFLPAAYADFIIFGTLGAKLSMNQIQPGRVTIAHPVALEKLVGKNGWSFFDMLRFQIGLDESNEFTLPVPYRCDNEDLRQDLVKQFAGKKVIYLFDSARAMRIAKDFSIYIECLINDAVERGYEIVVNGNKGSGLINNDLLIPEEHVHYLDVGLNDIPWIAEYFKNVVVLRNGIADMLTSANINMMVLYSPCPSNFLGNQTRYIDYFPLRHYKKRARILEMELTDINIALEKTFDLFENV